MGQTGTQNAPSLGDLVLRLIHNSLGPHKSAPNGISIGLAIFAQYTRVTNNNNNEYIYIA